MSFREAGAKVGKSEGIDVGENERKWQIVERSLMWRLETV